MHNDHEAFSDVHLLMTDRKVRTVTIGSVKNGALLRNLTEQPADRQTQA
jgi:hypothetical protein